MDHVENVEIEEIVEIIREFTKHSEKNGRQGETSVANGNYEVVNNFLLFNF